MPLSTVLGAQSLIKPGVCTTATRPSSPYTGQMIYDTTVATTLVWNGTAWIASGGKVLQVVNFTTAVEVNTTSTSFVTTGLTASITPSATSSRILVIATTPYRMSGNANTGQFTLFRGTVAGTHLGTGASTGFGIVYSLGGEVFSSFAAQFLDSPNTTSATSYTVGLKVGAATVTLSAQRNTDNGTLTLMEISA